MAIYVDTANAGYAVANTASSVGFNHVVASGQNRKVFVFLSWENSSVLPTVTGFTYAGYPLKVIATITADTGPSEGLVVGYVDNDKVPVGSNVVYASVSAGGDLAIAAICVTGSMYGDPSDIGYIESHSAPVQIKKEVTIRSEGCYLLDAVDNGQVKNMVATGTLDGAADAQTITITASKSGSRLYIGRKPFSSASGSVYDGGYRNSDASATNRLVYVILVLRTMNAGALAQFGGV